ncbi:SDR family oxidoreductase [Blastococcus sp. SYSU D00820]
MSRRIAVTGAASGIGRALTELLTARGETVTGVDLAGTDVAADLGTPDGRAAAVAAVLDRTGGVLDALVACAGTSVPGVPLVSVNFFGVTEVAEGLRPALAAAPAPRVAVVGSISGTQPTDPAVVAACLAGDEPAARAAAQAVLDRGLGNQLYPSSKAALARWVRRTCVAPGWADAGIALNAVAPGVVLTPMTEPLLADERMRAVMDRAVPMPLNGHASAEVPARALAWLTSEENSHVTGQVLYLDGGAEVTLRGAGVF